MQNTWISVNDKLPEQKGSNFSERCPVIVKYKKGEQGMHLAFYNFAMEGWINANNAKFIDNVTYWMPLPELPNS